MILSPKVVVESPSRFLRSPSSASQIKFRTLSDRLLICLKMRNIEQRINFIKCMENQVRRHHPSFFLKNCCISDRKNESLLIFPLCAFNEKKFSSVELQKNSSLDK